MKRIRVLICLSGSLLLAACTVGGSVTTPTAPSTTNSSSTTASSTTSEAGSDSPASKAASASTMANTAKTAKADPVAAFYPADEEVSLDLDLDGDSEIIRFSATDLTIDGVSYHSKIQDFTEDEAPDYSKFLSADINKADDQLEIAFMGRGPSDDPTTYFYTFRAGDLREVGQIPDYITSPQDQFDGKGHITGIKRLALLQTWFGTALWQLAGDTIELVPDQIFQAKEYDWMETIILKKMLPVYLNIGDAEPYARMAPQEVKFLATDDKAWVQILAPDGKDGDGMTGWFKITPFDLITDLDLPANEVFDNLSNAD